MNPSDPKVHEVVVAALSLQSSGSGPFSSLKMPREAGKPGQVLPCLLFPEDSKDANSFTFNDKMTLVSSERNGSQGKRKFRFGPLQSRIFTGLEDLLYLWTKVNSF